MSSTTTSKSEKSFITTGLLGNPPRRLDGRLLHQFRSIELETGVAPLANGSAKLSIGRSTSGSKGGTEVVAAVKLEVENIGIGYDGVDVGRILCAVNCSPAAYPHLSTIALDDLQHDLTTVVHQTLSNPTLHPKNLGILPGKKSWLVVLDLVVLSDAGNVYDALFMAARAAFWDTKVPRTRKIEYSRKAGGLGDMDVDDEALSGFDTRAQSTALDFEIPDYWDEGEDLDGKDRWPVSVTLNVVSPSYFLDANTTEESAINLRILLVCSIQAEKPPYIQAIRTLGEGELTSEQYKQFIKQGEKHAKEIAAGLKAKLKDEDQRRNRKVREGFARTCG